MGPEACCKGFKLKYMYTHSRCLPWTYGLTTNVGESVGQWVSQSELHVQKSCERTTVQCIDCCHMHLWYLDTQLLLGDDMTIS